MSLAVGTCLLDYLRPVLIADLVAHEEVDGLALQTEAAHLLREARLTLLA